MEVLSQRFAEDNDEAAKQVKEHVDSLKDSDEAAGVRCVAYSCVYHGICFLVVLSFRSRLLVTPIVFLPPVFAIAIEYLKKWPLSLGS